MTKFDPESVSPETESLIEHARRLGTAPAPALTDPNIGTLLARRASQFPDKPFLTFCEEDASTAVITYSQFYDSVRRLAAQLRDEMGLRHGDRVATMRGNDPFTVAVYFAAWLSGIAVAPLNCSEDDERLGYILDNSEARAVFVAEAQAERAAGLGRPHLQWHITRPHDGAPEYTLPAAAPGEQLPEPSRSIDGSSDALLVYTSGTTGAPKGVLLDQNNLMTDAHSIAEWHRFAPEDRAMCVLPIHHVNGTVVTLMTPLYSGGSVVLNRRFSAHTFWRVLAAERCTWVSVVPTVLAFLCERGEGLTALDLTRFRHFICGAGPLTTELAARFDAAFGLRVVHGYGLSETTCYSSFLPIDLGAAAYRHWMIEQGYPSIGCAISANEMAIHDAEGNALPDGIRGEIVARGPNVMRCYFKRPDANRDTFAHGWFRTGDEGFTLPGPDGASCYFITGRLKELIIRGGVNYSPFDIDEVLSTIPGVRAAMAVGFDNSIYGEEVGAYVQLEAGATLTEAEIIAACRRSLPFAKSPKVVVFGDTFPVTSTGKYQRGRLKPLFAAWRETQFREERRPG